MEAHPPSYETATLVDVWDIVARWLPSIDLCSAALVCSKWHAAFAPHIWGNPASHFGMENDAVYVALTRFKRTLQTARLFVRTLTHTLHLPPAHAEIYNGPHADWLHDVLVRLPNLQSLIVRGLPFFDHAALQALSAVRPMRPDRRYLLANVAELPGSAATTFQSPMPLLPAFGLRLLDASRCPNITSSGLASALQRFEGLLYLDLSFSYPARSNDVLRTLRRFAGLQVLKLRGLNLKDDAVEILGASIGTRVRSLDLRDNRLTDRAVRTLLDHCFLRDDLAEQACAWPSGQRSPLLLPYIGSEMLGIYQGEDFEGFLRNAFTGRFVSRLAIEDVASSGITHLYLAGNLVTVEGISGLIRSERLHVLDVGSVSGVVVNHLLQVRNGNGGNIAMPGVEKLSPIVAKHASEAMRFLRIDHGLVTQAALSPRHNEVVPGRVELGDTSLPYNTNKITELDGIGIRPHAVELPAGPQTPRHELEGDPMGSVGSPATDQSFQVTIPAESTREARRGSAFAPEVVDNFTSDEQGNALISPVTAIDSSTSANGPRSAVSPVEHGRCGASLSATYLRHSENYPSILVGRGARLDIRPQDLGNLHPAMLPHVTTLVLTDVPPFSPSRETIDRIILFIKQCAEEASLASKKALSDYAAPPGRAGHASALKESANRIFALKRLVLELKSDQSGQRNTKTSLWTTPNSRSATEDRDSENLWSASEADFSFFGDEECVFPTLDTGRFTFFSGTNEKEVSQGSTLGDGTKQTVPVQDRIDNIQLLSNFRKERQAAHQRQLAAGNHDSETEGFWMGVVQVVRSTGAVRSDEQEDYYGNKFTNNYLYR